MLKDEILNALREADTEYVSGQQLCSRFGVSRTAVWKAIGRLREEGYAIEAVTNRGYRLGETDEEESDLFNAQEIERFLHTRWAGHPLVFKKQTGSTNDDILRMSDEGAAQGTLAVAAAQTAGKGRRGRTWISVPDCNIYMSILLRPALRADKAPMSTLVMALSACQAVTDLFPEISAPHADGNGLCAGIKWPNDLVIGRESEYRKFTGILTEMRLEETQIRDVVVGIGINVNETDFSDEIRQSATSVKLALGKHISRAQLTARIWERFEENYEVFEAAGSLLPLKDAYEALLVNIGRRVRVLDPQAPFEGTAEGITQTGELIVRTDEGEIRCVGAGEVSVRGVNGYV